MDVWWSRHRNLITSTWLFILFLKCKKNCKLFIGTIFNYQVCKERLFIVCRLWFFYNDGTARARLTFVRLCIVCRIKEQKQMSGNHNFSNFTIQNKDSVHKSMLQFLFLHCDKEAKISLGNRMTFNNYSI